MGFLLRRSALLVVVLLIVSMFTFLIVNVLPGDVAQAILGDLSTPEQVAALRTQLGLDQPLVTRYIDWVGDLLRGDLGVSLQYGQPIGPIIADRLANSAILGLAGLLITIPVAIGLGIAAATHAGGLIDRAITGFAATVHSIPEYVVGVMLILIFSVWLGWLPGASLMDPSESPLSRPAALVLPIAVLVIAMLAFLCQITRATMIEALRSPYVRTAELKGIPRSKVIFKHAFPNALPPIIVEIGINLGFVIGGQVVIENVFAYPGFGQLITTAVAFRDVPMIQNAAIIIAAAYGVGNLMADTIAYLLSPRLRSR